MKKLLLISIFAICGNLLFSQVTIGDIAEPDASALLDLKNQPDKTSTRGLLLPRVVVSDTVAFTLIGESKTAGMLIYNTAAKTADNSGPGIYYWAGTSWRYVNNGTSSGSTDNNWLLGGNTNGSEKTIGTNDTYDLPIVTDNTEKMRVTFGGKVGIGTTTPASTLTVNGSFAAAVGSMKTGNVTIADNDFYVSWNGTSNATATLPQSQSIPNNFKGRIYCIKNTSTMYTLTVVPYGAERIDEQGAGAGIASLAIKPGEAVNLINNGNTSGITWEVISYLNAVPMTEIPGAISAVYNSMGTTEVIVPVNTIQDLAGVSQTFTLDKPSIILITYSALPLPQDIAKPVQGSIDLVVDGTKNISSYYSATDSPTDLIRLGNYSTSQAVVNLNAGSHTIKLQAKSWYNATVFNRNPVGVYSGADSGDLNSMKARMTIIVFNK